MHAYPENLVTLVRRQWREGFVGGSLFDLPVYETPEPLPRPAVLEDLLSTCYQASLLREEGRSVRFRLILIEPGVLQGGNPPFVGLQPLPFTKALPLSADGLRRLAAAAAFESALIGARVRADDQPAIWGIVYSGQQWLQALEGSRRTFPALPPALVVNVNGPGNLTVAKGSLAVARLVGGRLTTPMPGMLEIEPPDDEIERLNQVLLAAHERTRRSRGQGWARLDTRLISQIRRQVSLRILSAIRRTRHGGTLLLLPPALLRTPNRWSRLLRIKYAFPEGPARRLVITPVLRLLEALAKECGHRSGAQYQVTWRDYLTSTDAELRESDEALTEAIHLIGSLSAVDGAVVVGQPLQLLGFGAEISGPLAAVAHVARALDTFGERTELQSTLDVGTRHRSAYRFCHSLPGAVALVVSQDGSIRVVKRVGNKVVSSEHLSTGVLDY